MNLRNRFRSGVRRVVKGKRPAGALDVERAEQMFYISYLRDGMVAFDIGANVGELTLMFSRFVGASGRVHSFEAASGVFERLRTVCTLAGRTNVTLNHAAVADAEGTLRLNVYDEEFSGWNTLADRPLEKYGIENVHPVAVEDVAAVTVDAYCERSGIERVDLLKIDVEGAEYQVLRGAARMLREKRVGCVVFEIGQTTFDMGNRPSEIGRFLAECGYEVRNVVAGDRAFPGGDDIEAVRFSVHVARPAR